MLPEMSKTNMMSTPSVSTSMLFLPDWGLAKAKIRRDSAKARRTTREYLHFRAAEGLTLLSRFRSEYLMLAPRPLVLRKYQKR
jgi:hypothetical protein